MRLFLCDCSTQHKMNMEEPSESNTCNSGESNVSDELNKIEEFAHKRELIDWWYFGGIFEKNQTPISEWTFISNFVMARGFVDNLVCILVPPHEEQEPIDLSGWGLKAGCIRASSKELNVTCQTNNWVKGGYPHWHLHLERTKENHNYVIDLQFQAQVASNFRVYAFQKSYLNHFAVFRQRMEGSIKIDDEIYPVTGISYYEQMNGFIDPKSSRGWYWYCVPVTEAKDLSINIALGVSPTNQIFHRFVYFTEDGEHFGQFLNYEFEIMEERSFNDVTYPFKFRITEENEDGKLDAIVTRTSNPSQKMHHTPFGTVAFITGNANISGKITWMGKSYNLLGRSIGSSFLIVY